MLRLGSQKHTHHVPMYRPTKFTLLVSDNYSSSCFTPFQTLKDTADCWPKKGPLAPHGSSFSLMTNCPMVLGPST